jgi:hypothetical protein
MMAPIFKMVPSGAAPTKSSPASQLAPSPPHAARPPGVHHLSRDPLLGMRSATLAAIALAGLVAPPCEVALAQDVAALAFAIFGAGIRRRQKCAR